MFNTLLSVQKSAQFGWTFLQSHLWEAIILRTSHLPRNLYFFHFKLYRVLIFFEAIEAIVLLVWLLPLMRFHAIVDQLFWNHRYRVVLRKLFIAHNLALVPLSTLAITNLLPINVTLEPVVNKNKNVLRISFKTFTLFYQLLVIPWCQKNVLAATYEKMFRAMFLIYHFHVD